jgi:hypothetical protein
MTKIELPDVLSLRQAAFVLDLNEGTLRRLATENKVKSTKTEAGKFQFKMADLEAYKAKKATGGNGKVSGKQFVIRIPADKFDAAKEALAALGIEAPTPRFAKKVKTTTTE